MAFDIVVRDRIENGISLKLRAIERQASQTNRALDRMRLSLNGLGRNTGLNGANRSFNDLATNVNRTNTQISNLSNNFTRATNSARRLLSTVLLLQGVEPFIEGLDAYQTLQNRLLGVSKVVDVNGIEDVAKSTARLTELTRQLFGVAERSRVGVESLAKTYRRFDMALAGVGATQQESMRITETASKLLSLSGANAGEAASALLQLSQAFNKGKLDGEEFRAAAELMPEVIDAITQVLGISRKEIFDYSRNGKITLEVLRKAFGLLADQVDEDFKRLPRTVGNALTQLYNDVIKFFGESSQGKSFLNSIIAGIDWIGDNLPLVTNLMKSFIVLLGSEALVYFGSSLFSIQGLIFGLGQIIPATILYFTFFADQIAVTADGFITLQDVVIGFFNVLTDNMSNGKGFFETLLSPETAQKAFDFMKDGLERAIELLKVFITGATAFMKASYDAVSSLSWEDVGMMFLEGFAVAGGYIRNGIITIFQELLYYGGVAIDSLRDNILDFLIQVSNVLMSLGSSLSDYFGGSAIRNFSRDLTRILLSMKGTTTDFGITDMLEGAKADIEQLSPTIDKTLNIWENSYRDTHASMKATIDKFYSDVSAAAHKSAAERMSAEAAQLEASKENFEALRGYQKEAMDAFQAPAINKSSTGQSSSNNGTDNNLSWLQFLNDDFVEIGQSVGKLKDLGDPFEKQILSSNVLASGLNLVGVNLGVILGATVNYGDTSVFQLDRISSKAITAGDISKESQVGTWQAASNAISEYAANAIEKLNQITAAAQRTASASSAIDPSLKFGTRTSYNPSRGGLVTDQVIEFGSGKGFASGGYTGSGARNRVAGFVHGQEFVMPAEATSRNRAALEAMRSGSSIGGDVQLNVTVENHASGVSHQVQQISPTEIRIIAREVVNNEAPGAVARSLSNRNSVVSKSLRSTLRR